MAQKPLSLVYVLNKYSDDDSSHYNHILNLVEELALQKARVALLIERSSGRPELRAPSVKVVTQKKRTGIARALEFLRLLGELKANGFDTVFVRISPTAALLATVHRWIRGGRVFYWQSGTTHAHDLAKPFNLKKVLWFARTRIPFLLATRLVDYFVTGPESMISYYERELGIPRYRIRMIYNDVDLTRLAATPREMKASLKQAVGVDQNRMLLLFVHRLSPVKRTLFYLPYLIEEILRLGVPRSSFNLLIVGDGDDAPELKHLVEERKLGDVILMRGKLPNREIHNIYAAADIFVNPTFEEGFPRVLLEAMASALPVVTTDAGGICDIVGSHQRKFVVPAADRAAFAQSLVTLMRDHSAQSDLSVENRASVQRFSTQAVAEQIIATFAE